MEKKIKQVDLNSVEIMKELIRAHVYKKQGQVKARLAKPDEEITTILKNGVKETVNKANKGDWIVTNPDGEEYIISNETFLNRYEATKEKGVYTAKGYCRAIVSPFDSSIEIMAPWGSPQIGEEDCYIVYACNVSGKCEGKPYLIDRDAFLSTYKKAGL